MESERKLFLSSSYFAIMWVWNKKGVKKMNYKRVTRLKRKYLVIFTIILTMFSLKLINFVNITIQERIEDVNKKIQACDSRKSRACTYYEIRNISK